MTWRYFTVRDFLVGPSAASSNGHIADGRIKVGMSIIWFGRLRNSKSLRKNQAKVVRI